MPSTNTNSRSIVRAVGVFALLALMSGALFSQVVGTEPLTVDQINSKTPAGDISKMIWKFVLGHKFDDTDRRRQLKRNEKSNGPRGPFFKQT